MAGRMVFEFCGSLYQITAGVPETPEGSQTGGPRLGLGYSSVGKALAFINRLWFPCQGIGVEGDEAECQCQLGTCL